MCAVLLHDSFFCCITTNKDVSILDMSFEVSNFGTFGVYISVWMTCKWIWLYYNLWYFKTMVTLQLDYWGKMLHPEMKRIEYCPPCMIVCHFTFKTVDQRFFGKCLALEFPWNPWSSLIFPSSCKCCTIVECVLHLMDRGWFNTKSWQFYFVSAN